MKASDLFRRNEHTIDRALRILIGLTLLALVFVGPKTYWGLIGLIPLATGLAGSCPFYSVCNLSTRGNDRRSASLGS